MKEDRELLRRMGREWSRFWIAAGMEVYHRNQLEGSSLKDGSFVMIVDAVIKKPVKLVAEQSGKEKPFRIVGVKCHWFIDGDLKSGLFHTRELIPAKVVRKKLVEDWMER